MEVLQLDSPPILTEELEQLALFAPVNPLKERFESEFYRGIPKTPGIYWMLNEREQIIYVGKAKNLRQRLRSYRQLIFERQSRKTRRLLVSIRKIHWMEHVDETAALLAENECLRLLKPEFNILNTEPESYAYFGFRLEKGGLLGREQMVHLRMGFDPRERFHARDLIAGPFKGVARLRRVHASLSRWIWAVSQGHCSWPHPLARSLSAPMAMALPLCAEARAKIYADLEVHVSSFLMGLAPLPELVLPEEEPSLTLQMLWRDDQTRLASFFSTTSRLAQLRRKTGREYGLIERHEVDDLIVLAGRERREQRELFAGDTAELPGLS